MRITINTKARNAGKSAILHAMGLEPISSPSGPPNTPDPLLPLLKRDSPAEFVKLLDGVRKLGLVYSQCRHNGDIQSHPSCFYVEFPAESGNFREIDANRLAASLGDSSARSPFTRKEVARVIERTDSRTDVHALLKACTPR